MGSLQNRLKRLEDSSREGAVKELKRAWAALTDEELVLVFRPYVEKRSDKSEAEERAEKKARASMPEELIAAAIGLSFAGETPEEEISRRIKELNHQLGIFKRRSRVRSHLQATREGRGE
jgi:hypothetical protein